jgi:hypothetical protein
VDLHRLHGHLDRGLAGEELGHRGLRGVLLARVAEAGRPPGQKTRGLHLGGHVRELELDGLELPDGVAELPSVQGIAVRGLQRGLRDAQGEGGDPDAPAIQDAQGVDEPVAFLPEQVPAGMRQSSKTSSDVSDERTPSLSSFFPERNPLAPRSTMKAEMPFLSLALSVTAMTTATSASRPLVMKVLDP